MFDRVFSQSSGRVIAIARLSLAAVFLVATITDPSIPRTAEIQLVLLLYLAFAAVVVLLIWNNWWLDARIATATHATDMLFFMTVVLRPEGYASPYFLFFVFLLLSAAIRSGWRATLFTAAVAISLYLIAGLLVGNAGGPRFELQRFIIRSGYLIILSAILIWFGLRRRFSTGTFLIDAPVEIGATAHSPFHAALRHAKRVVKAKFELAVWTYPDGAQDLLRADGNEALRLPVAAAPMPSPIEHSFLFSTAKDRALLSPEAPRPRFRTANSLIDPGILRNIEPHDGLAIPVRSHLGHGYFLFWSIDALHSDHLELGNQLSGQLAQMIEHSALILAREEGAIARERMSLARDLHDGIVQFLAGSTYRIEGISRSVTDRPDVAANLQDLKELMLLEQEDLRTSIAALRIDTVSLSQSANEARALCDRLARHWQIGCAFKSDTADVTISSRVHLDVLQIIREAVANAARHSSAKSMNVRLRIKDGVILLTVLNDGVSAGPAPENGPWSIRERVQEVGGTVSMSSGRRGTKLSVQFPITGQRA